MGLVWLVLTACSVPTEGGGGGSGDPQASLVQTPTTGADAVVDSLDAGTDFCAYESGVITPAAVPPTTEDGYLAEWSPYETCLDGYFWAGRRILDYPSGRYEGGEALATFFSVASRTITCLLSGSYQYNWRPSDTSSLRSGFAYVQRILPGFLTATVPLARVCVLRTPAR